MPGVVSGTGDLEDVMAIAAGRVTARMIAAFAAVALTLASFAVFFDTSGAGTSIIPRSGAQGLEVAGTHQGQTVELATNLLEAELGSSNAGFFTIDVNLPLELGVGYEETTWGDEEIPGSDAVSRVLHTTRATAPGGEGAVEIAATQAAIWHFSDGFDLDPSLNQTAVVSRYDELLAAAVRNADAPRVPPTIDPPLSSVGAGEPAFFTVSVGSASPVSLEVSSNSTFIHPARGAVCDSAQTVSTLTATSTVCLTSDQRPNSVALTARAPEETDSTGRVFSLEQRQKLITASEVTSGASATAEATWAPPVEITSPTQPDTTQPETTQPQTTEPETTQPDTTPVTEANRAPTLSLECPDSRVDGRPATFVARGDDEDGDSLTYRWFVNGVEVIGESGASVDLAVTSEDRISVVATDGSASSEAVLASCPSSGSSEPPTVTVSCPSLFVFDEPTRFVANGVDPGGDLNLVYAWYVDGVPVAGETGAAFTVAVGPDEVVSVVATNTNGQASAAAGTDCVGNSRPSVSLECPEGIAYGEPFEFTATAADADADELIYRWSVGAEVVANQTSRTATLVLAEGDIVSVVAIDDLMLESRAATSSCTDTGRPTVELGCPEVLAYGEPTLLTAVGSDPDGDSIVYRWSINGEPVPDGTSDSLSVVLEEGDTVAVAVSDPTGATSETIEAACSGSTRPNVEVMCPTGFVTGTPAIFTATASNVAGRPLFTWALNGRIVADEMTRTTTIAASDGDVISVNVMDTEGLTSSTVSTECSSIGAVEAPPQPIPSSASLMGTQILKAAQSNIAAMSIAQTGLQVFGRVLTALAVMIAGAATIVVSRRRSHR